MKNHYFTSHPLRKAKWGGGAKICNDTCLQSKISIVGCEHPIDLDDLIWISIHFRLYLGSEKTRMTVCSPVTVVFFLKAGFIDFGSYRVACIQMSLSSFCPFSLKDGNTSHSMQTIDRY